jgi:secondary thiamine-phosphate synthase enzyme
MQAVKVLRRTLTLSSEQHFQVIDVTKQIRDVVLAAEIREGVLLVNPLHTTCALLVSDSHWADDLKTAMERLVAERAGYKHDDPRFSDCERGNACSHLRAALLGRSVAVGISGGELSLGSFQSILLVELDGPRRRGVDVQLLGA